MHTEVKGEWKDEDDGNATKFILIGSPFNTKQHLPIS